MYTNQFATSERMMRSYLRRGYEFYLHADTAVAVDTPVTVRVIIYPIITAMQMVSMSSLGILL